MSGNLIYRYSLDQIELEGYWSLNNEAISEKFSYLFLKKCDKIICPLKLDEIKQANSNEININGINQYNFNNFNKTDKMYEENLSENNNLIEKLNENYIYKDEYHLSICSANLYEALTISHPLIFNCITNYLTGEFHGFFIYFEKTIEDRFNINFDYDENKIRINGKYYLIIFRRGNKLLRKF
jgi:hypothetical protein